MRKILATLFAFVLFATPAFAGMAFPYPYPAVDGGKFNITIACTSGTVTLATNTLSYSRDGHHWTFGGLVTIASVSAPTGTATVSGFPWVALGNTNSNYATMSVRIDGGAAGMATMTEGLVLKNSATAQMDQFAAGSIGALCGNLAGGGNITFSGQAWDN